MLTIEILVDPEVDKLLGHSGLVENEIRAAVTAAASVGECHDGEVGVRVSDDANIHAINREFLQHDYPTDVISFPYALSPPKVEGELVVSIDTAASEVANAREVASRSEVACPGGAPNVDWTVREELLLYVIHGTLHLVGFDDTNDAVRLQMRAAEKSALRLIGIELNE